MTKLAKTAYAKFLSWKFRLNDTKLLTTFFSYTFYFIIIESWRIFLSDPSNKKASWDDNADHPEFSVPACILIWLIAIIPINNLDECMSISTGFCCALRFCNWWLIISNDNIYVEEIDISLYDLFLVITRHWVHKLIDTHA